MDKTPTPNHLLYYTEVIMSKGEIWFWAIAGAIALAGLAFFLWWTARPKKCSSDSNCPLGTLCQSGTCKKKVCKVDGDCGGSYKCLGGLCEPNTCSTDGDCHDSELCINGSCHLVPGLTCKSDSDCGAGDVCDSNNTCVPKQCKTNADCGVGYNCVNQQGNYICLPNEPVCLVDGDCPKGTVCNLATYKCVQCRTGKDCDSGICNKGVCDLCSSLNCSGICIAGQCLANP